MKLTLIKPNIGRREHSLYVDNASMEPLQLGILAALTPKDVEVVMYDDRLETIPYEVLCTISKRVERVYILK